MKGQQRKRQHHQKDHHEKIPFIELTTNNNNTATTTATTSTNTNANTNTNGAAVTTTVKVANNNNEFFVEDEDEDYENDTGGGAYHKFIISELLSIRPDHKKIMCCWKYYGLLITILFTVYVVIIQHQQTSSIIYQQKIPYSSSSSSSRKIKIVKCYNNNYPNSSHLTFDEWLKQDFSTTRSIDLCDPNFLPKRQSLNLSKPVKVFILLGQSNMFGMGTTYNVTNPMSLENLIRKQNRYQHLNVWRNDNDNEDNDTTTTDNNNKKTKKKKKKKKKLRLDVRYVSVNGNFEVHNNDWLQLPPEPDDDDTETTFGIELQFGYIMGELFDGDDDDSPILLLKSCTGNRALGWDLLPPTVNERYNDTTKGYTYPSYGEMPEHWLANTTKPENDPNYPWYAGKQYDTDVNNAKRILENLDDYYPGLVVNTDDDGRKQQPNYEITGFLWWQGQRDTMHEGHAIQYESNLIKFIDSIRDDFDNGYNKAREAKFVLASIGFGGYNMTGFTNWWEQINKDSNRYIDDDGSPYLKEVFDAQMAVNNYTKYPKYYNNVYAIDIRSSFREPPPPPSTTTNKQSSSKIKPNWNWVHYNNDARVYMEVGNAFGWAMANLLFTKK